VITFHTCFNQRVKSMLNKPSIYNDGIYIVA
jgi:hypothetical protein